jgi:hypothetical protein
MNSTTNRIYSFGGVSTSQVPLDIIEYFDINENKWTYVGSMPAPFVAGCVVSHNDVFYVLGGRNGLDLGRHDTCYMYKPEPNNEWTELSKMSVGRFNFGACVLNEKIFVFGGQRYDESEENYFTREALDSVEVFDLKTQQWLTSLSQIIKMPAPLYNTGVSVFDLDVSDSKNDTKCIYLCGTTECKYSNTKLFGFMFTSVFRLAITNTTTTNDSNDSNDLGKFKWTVVEHDVSDIKTYYRCVAARVNTRKLHKFLTDIQI